MENINISNDFEIDVLLEEEVDAEIFMDTVLGDFEMVLDSICNANKIEKILEYSNENYCVYSFIKTFEQKTIQKVGEFKKVSQTIEVKLFEILDKKSNESEFHYLANPQLHPNFILNLINRREILENKSKSL